MISSTNTSKDDIKENNKKKLSTRETFETIIGVSPNGVISYSSYYKTKPQYKYLNSFISIPELGKTQLFTGTKWQCVEYARRYLLLTFGITFSSVRMAWNIFTDLNSFENAIDKSPIKIKKYFNGSTNIAPSVHSLLIWSKEYHRTGHVAVITNVTDSFIEICEQNWNNKLWKNPNFSRRLKLINERGSYFIKESNILGWINIDKN
jgi:glutathionylspermidine amidase/synthetase